jgi:hypothetical protein
LTLAARAPKLRAMPNARSFASPALAVLLPAFLSLAACGSTAATPDGGKDARVSTQDDGGAEAPASPTPDADSDATSEASDVADAPAEMAPAEVAQDAAPEVDPACKTIAPDATRTVHLRITADNECSVFVNGTDVGMTTSWPSPVTIDVSLFIYPGKVNVIGVMANNTSSQDGADRGIIGELDDLSDGGSTPVIVTDGAWRSSKTEQSGWPALLFDDSSWAQATVVGNHGDAPWGALLGTSNAKWIWSAPIPVATADKPNLETAFFRRKFYFGTDGMTISNTPSCP